jgi:hypothetical protein
VPLWLHAPHDLAKFVLPRAGIGTRESRRLPGTTHVRVGYRRSSFYSLAMPLEPIELPCAVSFAGAACGSDFPVSLALGVLL